MRKRDFRKFASKLTNVTLKCPSAQRVTHRKAPSSLSSFPATILRLSAWSCNLELAFCNTTQISPRQRTSGRRPNRQTSLTLSGSQPRMVSIFRSCPSSVSSSSSITLMVTKRSRRRTNFSLILKITARGVRGTFLTFCLSPSS